MLERGKVTQGNVLFMLNSPVLKSGGHCNLQMLSFVVNGDIGFVELGQVRLVMNPAMQGQVSSFSLCQIR